MTLEKQNNKKIITIPQCLSEDCNGLYEDIFQTVVIECHDKKHKGEALAVLGNRPANLTAESLTDTAKRNDSKK